MYITPPPDAETVIISRKLLERIQAVLNPLSGFLRRGSPQQQRHIDAIRDEIRTALAADSNERYLGVWHTERVATRSRVRYLTR